MALNREKERRRIIAGQGSEVSMREKRHVENVFMSGHMGLAGWVQGYKLSWA